MREKIVILEFADEAKAFLSYCQKKAISANEFKIIALRPNVQVFLKRNNIFYENTLPFFSNDSHKRIMIKSEEWINFLRVNINLIDGREVKEAYNNTFRFYTRFYVNYLLMCIEIISGIYEKNEIESIHACVYPNMIKFSHSRNLEENERCAGIIAKMFAEDKGIPFYEVPIDDKPISWEEKKLRTGLIVSWVYKLISNLHRSLLKRYIANREIILCTSKSYNLDKFVQRIKSRIPESRWVLLLDYGDADANIREEAELFTKQILKILRIYRKDNYILADAPLKIFLSSKSVEPEKKQQLEANINRIIENLRGDWQSIFAYKNTNVSQILAEIIEKHLKSFLLQFQPKCKALTEFLRSFNIKLSVVVAARNFEAFLGELRQFYDIPGLMISHGTVKPPANEIERIEYYHMGLSLVLSEFYRYAAIQTPSEERHAAYYQCKNELIRSGPIIFSKVDRGLRDKMRETYLKGNTRDKIFLYSPTIKTRTNLRFYVVETLDEFFSSAADLVNAVNEIDGAWLMIRFHPALKMDEKDFRALLPQSDKLIVHKNRPFYEALSVADLSINFASTSIDDSLRNLIPVLLYDKWNRYKHYDGQELSPTVTPQPDAVYYVNDSRYLKSALKWVLDNHLNKDVSPVIFNKYTYSEEYFDNIVKFVSSQI